MDKTDSKLFVSDPYVILLKGGGGSLFSVNGWGLCTYNRSNPPVSVADYQHFPQVCDFINL